jgi:hypothetical protein
MTAKPFPDRMDAHAREAEGRTLARCAPPRIKISRGKHGWKFASPYGKLHDDQWYFLLLDAFGTKHAGVLDYFLNSICELVPAGDKWVAQDRRAYWYPSEPEFNAVLAIVASMRPQNEAHAAYAAQLGALHLASMKLGRHASQNGCDLGQGIAGVWRRNGASRATSGQGAAQASQSNDSGGLCRSTRQGGRPLWSTTLRSRWKRGCSAPRAAWLRRGAERNVGPQQSTARSAVAFMVALQAPARLMGSVTATGSMATGLVRL